MADGINLGKAWVQIVPSAEGFAGKLNGILDSEATMAGAKAGSKMSGGFSSALKTGLGATTAIIGTTVAGTVALGKSIVSTAQETASFGDNVDKLSQKIGISANAFQEWDYVFSQNGADISILETGMKTLSSAVFDAGVGSKSAQEKFKTLGISYQELGKMSQEDIFSTVIARLQEMPEGAERTALAADLLGKSAMELQPLLNQTASDTEALKNKAHDLGMVMSDDAVKNAAAFTDSMDNLTRAFDGAKNKIGAEFLPNLTQITNGLAELIAGNESAQESITAGFQGIGDSIANAMPGITSGLTTIVSSVLAIAPDIISSLAQGLLGALPQLMPVATEMLTTIITGIVENLPMILNVGIELIMTLVSGLSDALPQLIPAMVDAILTMVEGLLDNIPLLIDCAIKLITGLSTGLINALPILIEKGPTIIAKLVTGLIQAIPQLVTAGGRLLTAIVQGIMNLSGQMANAGRNLVEGLKNGFMQSWNNFKSWVTDKVRGLIDSVKGAFQIHSPSRVFAQIGDYCVQGFNVGFEDFGEDALDQVDSVVDQIADQSGNIVGDINSVIAGDISTSPSRAMSVSGNDSAVLDVLSKYLPLLENVGETTVRLEGDADGLFRQIKSEASRYTKSTGLSAFA